MSDRPERLSGIVASQGVAVGPVAILDRRGSAIPRRRMRANDSELEVRRLREAIESSRAEIESVRLSLSEELSDYGLILDAHMLMHRDELLVDAATRAIRNDGMNAEWALRRAVDGLKEPLLKAGTAYFRERADDVEHVGQHIHSHLRGGRMSLPPLDQPVILFAHDLTPTDAARLLRSQVEGLVTVSGSATGHTALLARALEVPAVVGVAGAVSAAARVEIAMVDGFRGQVVFEPDEESRRHAERRAERYRSFASMLRERRDEPSRTQDGVLCEVYANVELPAEAAVVVDEGGGGIGLYRTEFMYLGRVEAPDEEEQLRIYADVIRVVAPRPVIIRTYDLGGDKLPDGLAPGPNPALGQRAIRLSLARPELFRTQVRAVLRAAVHGPVQLMFPLVTTVDEVRQLRDVVDQCVRELEAESMPHQRVPEGVMIEVPSSALLADQFAKEVDFFSVGTNDLVQYTLAVDRSDPAVAALADALDPAVLRLLHQTAVAAKEHAIPLSMCGDMAADPYAVPIALGLGYRNLSVPIGFLALTREVIRRINSEDAAHAAKEALACATAREVRRLIHRRFAPSLGELWSENEVVIPFDFGD